ncbi:MAG: hypothetical protein M0D54_19570 [Hyphomonadaceae bacterium JAD_PAG50586_4]|nr:MAG: hypothetical protein M0D54_19570 [Hyphomonadaceae bacterium JAD_PAG50586_4]
MSDGVRLAQSSRSILVVDGSEAMTMGRDMRRSKFSALVLAMVLAACSRPGSATAQTLSSATFRDAVANEIARQYPDLCVEAVDEHTLHLGRSQESCSEAVLNTSYVYQQYSADPANLQTYVNGLTSTASAAIQSLVTGSFVPDRARFVVVVRPSAYAATMRAAPGSLGGIWRPFVGDLIAVLVQKDGEKSRSLTAEDLAALRLTEAAAWNLAMTNLREQIGALDRTTNAQGAQVVSASSGLALSNLLLPETCSAGGVNFDAFVVDRATYFYADQRVPSATSMLAGYAGQLLQTSETLSDHLISCIDGNWYASAFDGANTWRPVGEEVVQP